MKKTLKIIFIVLASIIVVGISLFFILGFNKKFSFTTSISDKLAISENYSDEFKKIHINSQAGNIYLKHSENDFKVVIYGDTSTVDKKDQELFIESKVNDCVFLCINRIISKIEVYIPEDYENEIEIYNDFGDIEIESFINADLKIKESAGNVLIDSVKKADIENDLGKIVLKGAEIANIKESAGDVKLGEVGTLKVKNDYGNINISKVTKYMNLENDCGNTFIDEVDITENSYIQSNLGNIVINNTNEIYIDAKVDLGNLKINKNYQKSDITLKIKNDCGNIEVNN